LKLIEQNTYFRSVYQTSSPSH